MHSTRLVTAMATLLVFSAQAAPFDPLSIEGVKAGNSGAARKSLEVQLAKADALGTVYIDQQFSDKTASLPAGWRVPSWNTAKGTVTIDSITGNLLIDGTKAASTSLTAVLLPASLETLSNYRVDVEFTIDAAIDGNRWGSVMYRTSPTAVSPANEPYQQFAIRQNATGSSGTEFALRKAGGWTVQNAKPFTEAINKSVTYKATVVVYGNRVRQYLNDVLLHDVILSSELEKGGVGLQTAGALYRVKSVKVTEQLTPLPELDMPVAVQDTGTSVSMAPTLVQGMRTLASTSGDGSSNSLFTLDSALNLTGAGGEKLGTLKDLFAQSARLTVPVVRIKDQATVDALVAFSENTHVLYDITFLSDNVDILLSARKQLPSIRTAVDFTSSGLDDSTASLLKISGDTNRARAKIAVLPANLQKRAFVAHLQRLLLTVWAQSDAKTAEQAAQVLTTGVNGVIASDSTVFADVLRKLPANTLLRKPLVVGHRGMPAGTENDENTLESAKAAVAAGADAVENDIYITTDGHLVIMHDATVNRTTNGTGNIESMSLEQVKALRTKGQGLQVPTMKEFFEAFKNKPITHFIEIKSGTPSVVKQLKKEMAEAGVAEQSIAISFDTNQMKRSTTEIPELALGFLGGGADSGSLLNDVRTVLNATQSYNSTYNPSYANIKRATMEAAKHRGTTFWPWTIDNAADFYKFYSWGTHGLTTNYAKHATNFPVDIATAALPTRIALNEATSLNVNLTTQIGQVSTVAANELVVLGGTARAEAPSNGTVKFTSAGTAVVMPGYRYKMGDGTYSFVLMSKPVTLIVGDGSGSVTGTSNSASSGAVACSSAVPGQSSACTVTPTPGYVVAGVAPGGDCPAGSWNADFTVYTTGVISGNCSVNFTFKPLPAEASLSPVGKSGSVSATVSGGGTGLWGFDQSSKLAVAAASSTPENVSFPFGVTSFTLNGGEAGKQATVELIYPEALPTNAKYYKYGKTRDNAQPHWYVFGGAQISGNKVTLTLTDGADGDNDLTANGSISDPGGVGVAKAGPVIPPAAVASVPTLGAGAVMGLSGMLGALAWLRSRRRRNRSGSLAG